ncbi:rod shape-determining protein MreC [Granulicella sp. L46]|uniref:rod shape-determining protein MreC n=1 Tax=Granulicella sp. L46 TaxID=1641865 RepID=UPI0020B17431|nr:rod shape-determining protein MreC [Granulicella sp. L46]
MREVAARGCCVTMDSFFYRFRNPLVLIAIVLMQVIALAMQVQRPGKDADVPVSARAMEDAGSAPDGKHVSLLRRWTVTAMTPLETAVHSSSVKVRGAWGNYVDLLHTRQQDAALKQEVARLRVEEASFAEDAAQGRRLQTLLDFRQHYVTSTVAAQVIGTSGSERSHVLYLDKGSEDGLKPEMAVITPDGVVGKIRDVFPHTSQLLLISDSSSGAGVILASTRIRGIVKGTATGRVEIDNLTADSRIKVGELVVTSGGDLVFPRGLPVGTIESIAPDPLHQPYTAIVIKTAANLNRLEEVLVITGTSATLPPTAAQDAATAEATQDANQRAADLIAEKLPGLHTDGDAAPGAAGTPAVGADGKPVSDDPESQVGGAVGYINSGLPRPKPAVHPDKFTPGTVPPATELTPGAPASQQAPQKPQEQ